MAKTLPTRIEVPEELTWKLEDIYTTDAAWEGDFTALANKMPEVASLRGTLGSSSAVLVRALRWRDEVSQMAGKLASYARMRFDEDTTRAHYQALVDRSTSLITQLSAALSFMTPEVLSIPQATLDEWLASDPDLALYRHEIEDTNRARLHVRSSEIEELLAQAGEITQTPSRVFGMIDNADLRLPTITDANGQEFPLSKGNYSVFLHGSDRVLRQHAFEGLHDTFRHQQNTLAATFSAQVKQRIFSARQRGYGSTLEASLDGPNIPVAVYSTLIETVKRGLPALHRYLRLRGRILHIDEQHLYDLEAPLVPDVDLPMPFGEGRDLVIKAVAPLGSDYVSVLTGGLESRWIDVVESQGKRGGAYSNGGVYGVHPFVLLNYQDQLSDVFTLAHELGHSLHSHYTQATQPYPYAHYTLFLAEIASTFNESLLTRHLLATTTDKAVRAYILTQHLSRIRSTLYRQTMFADFEAQAHAQAEAGESLTPELLCGIYRELNDRYFGDAGVVVDELVAWEWSRIPHFYRSFYVFQYATGISASMALSKAVFEEGQPAVDRYLRMLRSGDSDYSIELLKAAGVDMTTPAPVEAAIAEFDRAVGELEELIG